MKYSLIFSLALLWSASSFAQSVTVSPISDFNASKIFLNDHVYYDRMSTSYCGCDYTSYARTGGRVDAQSCGYELERSRRDADVRAARIEYEHIFPISRVTEGRSCGTRANCRETDSDYNRIEADPHNLTPVIGEINALRSNYDFAEIDHISFDDSFGSCDFKIDKENRRAEPADNMKGFVARTYFYMAWAYGAPISTEKQAMLLRWHEAYPADDWEIERNRRIEQTHGFSNPFITGRESWSVNDNRLPAATGIDAIVSSHSGNESTTSPGAEFVGNSNSGIYFPKGCHWYDRIGQNNRVPFNSAAEAESAGYRAARNCG